MNFSGNSVTMNTGVSLQEGRQYIGPGKCEEMENTENMCL